LSIGISCGYQVVVIVTAVLPFLTTIPSSARIVLRLIIVFVIAALSWPSYIVFAISPAVSDFHQLGYSLWLLAPKFLYVGFPSDAIAKGIDCSVNGNIFGSVQEFSESPDVCTHRLLRFLLAMP
jgi:hypothetical protein